MLKRIKKLDWGSIRSSLRYGVSPPHGSRAADQKSDMTNDPGNCRDRIINIDDIQDATEY